MKTSKHHNSLIPVIVALIANLIIATFKTIVYILSRSPSMLSEAIHSFADSINQILLLIGNRLSKISDSDKHSFGMSKNTYLFGFLVSVLLFLMGGLYSIYHGYTSFSEGFDESKVHELYLGLIVLVVAFVIEFTSLIITLRTTKDMRVKTSLFKFIEETKTVEYVVCILEDVGSTLGCAIAFAGVTLTIVFKTMFFDALASVLIGLLLVSISIVLFRELHSLLIGESVSKVNYEIIKKDLSKLGEIKEIRTTHLSDNHILINAEVYIKTLKDIDKINKVKKQIRRDLNMKNNEKFRTTIYIEPELKKK